MGNNNINTNNNAVSVSELIELLHELDDTLYTVDVDQFVADTIKFDVPFSDIAWFLQWCPEALWCIENAYKPYGYFHIFENWDAYLAEGFDYYNDDPHQPIGAVVFTDAGLSGVWYVQMC